MAYKKKTWSEKLNNSKDLPKVIKIEGKMSKHWGTGTLVVPAPMEVNDLMKQVPKGKLITINEIRESLAKKHKATIGCPITTGIFSCIAARVADEEIGKGKKNVTPYWRTLKSDGTLSEKYPGGTQAQKSLLEAEGHKIVPKGKKWVVRDFKKSLAKI
jgi:alkylated DNA nucleotide flippase Atl1